MLNIIVVLMEWLITAVIIFVAVAIVIVLIMFIIAHIIQCLIIFGLLTICVLCLWGCYNVTR
jgi:hypothetical protein